LTVSNEEKSLMTLTSVHLIPTSLVEKVSGFSFQVFPSKGTVFTTLYFLDCLSLASLSSLV
jgi:hypothetical protein